MDAQRTMWLANECPCRPRAHYSLDNSGLEVFTCSQHKPPSNHIMAIYARIWRAMDTSCLTSICPSNNLKPTSASHRRIQDQSQEEEEVSRGPIFEKMEVATSNMIFSVTNSNSLAQYELYTSVECHQQQSWSTQHYLSFLVNRKSRDYIVLQLLSLTK